MDDYIVKPLSFEMLDEALARWLSPGPAEHPALDEARLEALSLALTREELSGMLRELSAEVAGEVEQIRAAGRGADRAELADAAHRIQNSAGLIGAGALAAAAAPLEAEARAERGRSAPWRPDDAELLTFTHQWERTRAAIARRLG
jgi:HPt (histidine-containing phosphotransfer) domain-containing protein